MNTFNLKIIASDKILYDGACEYLVVPMVDGGTKGFLPHHENVIVPIDVGMMKGRIGDANEIVAFVSNGLLEFIDNEALLVCVSAELPDQIDAIRAREAKERAEEQLRQKQSIIEYYQTKSNLARAMSRLKVTGKR